MVRVLIQGDKPKSCQKCGGEFPSGQIKTKLVDVKGRGRGMREKVQLCKDCWPTVRSTY